MSAALHPHDVQPTLDGIEPAVQTPALALPMVAINGLTRSAAIVRTHSDGSVSVEVVLEQQMPRHPRALPVLLRRTFHDRGSFAANHAAARALASTLLAGADVMALGRGLEQQRYLGDEVLALIECDSMGWCPQAKGTA